MNAGEYTLLVCTQMKKYSQSVLFQCHHDQSMQHFRTLRELSQAGAKITTDLIRCIVIAFTLITDYTEQAYSIEQHFFNY